MPDMQCPVCSSELITPPTDHEEYDALFYNCRQCGEYVLENLASVDRNFHDSKQLISAWIRMQNKRGNNHPFISARFFEEDWFKNLRNMGFPQTVNEKLDELLKSYAHIVKDDYGKIVKAIQYPTLISDIAGKNYAEIRGLNQLLAELEYLWTEPSHRNEHIRITAKGWQRLRELAKTGQDPNRAFVAMSFATELLHAWVDGIKPALETLGYVPTRIDQTHADDKIDDRIIAEMRRSGLLVADFTGHRSGVYFETGFAMGLGIPVVWTCKRADHEGTHFDTRQYQHLLWETPEELREKLVNHIAARIPGRPVP